MRQFLVLGLPRSRTFWASRFLALNGRVVQHNQFQHCQTIGDIVAWFDDPKHCASDPTVGTIWRDVLPCLTGVKVALIRRPVPDVLASLRGIGQDKPFMERMLLRYDEELDALEESGLAEVFGFNLLGTLNEAARLFQHCTGEPLDAWWWALMQNRNLQSPETGLPHELVIGPVVAASLAFAKEKQDVLA